MLEIWKPVAGWEGDYEVSNLGRVRSLDRVKIFGHTCGRQIARQLKGRLLRPEPHHISGHLAVNLSSKGKKTLHRQVHKLVLEAFVGLCPEGHECLHGDGIPSNNHLSNLRWGTRSQNILQDISRGVRDQQYGWPSHAH